MWRGSTVGTGWRAWLVAGVARSEPRSNSWFWIGGSSAASRSHSPIARATPICELSSSTVPYVSTRWESLATRWPPPSPVIPSSPVFV